MARRDMLKTAKQITDSISAHYDMTFDDVELIYNIIKNGDPAKGITLAFRYGYAMGSRAAKKEMGKREGAGGDGKLDKH